MTLLIPGFNDDPDELERLTAFVAGVSPIIPWHVTAFHQDYRMNDPANTTPEMLVRAAAIGRRNGLRYVYAGNLPGRVGDLENTRCHHCRALLIERYGYFIQQLPDHAGRRVPGMWDGNPGPMGRGLRRADHVDAVPAGRRGWLRRGMPLSSRPACLLAARTSYRCAILQSASWTRPAPPSIYASRIVDLGSPVGVFPSRNIGVPFDVHLARSARRDA